MTVDLYHGDNIAVLRTLPENSVDSVVTDPPYGLTFMNKQWDHNVPSVEFWREVFRVLKPGGYVLSFSGTRTYHRMVVNIEDAGFEIRDQIGWLNGKGMPKNHDVGKLIDKHLGYERTVIGVIDPRGAFDGRTRTSSAINTNWREYEDRDDVRDLSKKTITAPASDEAKQWDGWGTALKPCWEPCVVARKPFNTNVAENVLAFGTGALNINDTKLPPSTEGAPRRWPGNVIHDGSLEDDWVRYFYCAKASKTDRAGSKHPTVKPVALMTYLVKLVTPPGGTVLDPFAGSGTTGEAAVHAGFNAILIEQEAEYIEDIQRRFLLQQIDVTTQ